MQISKKISQNEQMIVPGHFKVCIGNEILGVKTVV